MQTGFLPASPPPGGWRRERVLEGRSWQKVSVWGGEGETVYAFAFGGEIIFSHFKVGFQGFSLLFYISLQLMRQGSNVHKGKRERGRGCCLGVPGRFPTLCPGPGMSCLGFLFSLDLQFLLTRKP